MMYFNRLHNYAFVSYSIKVRKWREWSTASDVDWGMALQREAVIRPLAEQRTSAAKLSGIR